MPSDTMTRVIGDVPRRWNGAYTPEFTSTDPREHTATAATRPIHTEAPAWFTTYATNAPAMMIAPYARLSTSVTPNCSVKPTAAIARTDAVTSPKPTRQKRVPLPARHGDHPARALSCAAVRFPTTFTVPEGL